MKNIVIAGTVGKDAEPRTTQSGKQVTGWSVAVKDGWGDNETTLWFDCSWWGQRGEKIAPHITKGGKITVSGELSTREYNGKTYMTISVQDVTLQGGSQQKQPQKQEQPSGGYGGGYDGGDIDPNLDIPF